MGSVNDDVRNYMHGNRILRDDARECFRTRLGNVHNRNPQFFTLFERFTNEAISRGHNNLSGWLIANRVRWETNIVTRGNEYKIKNDFIALFARLFMVRHQQYIGFFRTKRMKRLKRDVFKPKAPIDD